MSVKLVNKAKFFKKLKSTVPGIEAALTTVNANTASEMVAFAKTLAPLEDGILQASIRSHPGKFPTSFIYRAGGDVTTKAVRAGADASYDYAVGQEFGTRKMAANPFFWPAYRAVRRTYKGRVTRALRKAIKDAGFF